MPDRRVATVVSVREAVERMLAQRACTDPTFLAQMLIDPDSVLKPAIAELLGDDGELDLREVTTSVHVETDRHLHFVLTVDAPEHGVVTADGAGLAASLRDTEVGAIFDPDPEPLFGRTRRRCDPSTFVCTADTICPKECNFQAE